MSKIIHRFILTAALLALTCNIVISFGGLSTSGFYSKSQHVSKTGSALARTTTGRELLSSLTSSQDATEQSSSSSSPSTSPDEIFQSFASFLQSKQREIIQLLEEADGGSSFSDDKWGCFLSSSEQRTKEPSSNQPRSGGITRVIQDGNMIEKGAVSLTVIERSVLSAERAKTIRGRSGEDVREGDMYSAAALSIVLHTRSPMVPTFRSDVRIFLVRGSDEEIENVENDEDRKRRKDGIAWFGGGADLTPYYIFEEDIRSFHQTYKDLCDQHFRDDGKTYKELKQACDDYFYLPARKEHRGTGGIFFDDMNATEDALNFTKGVVSSWMPSWMGIVWKRNVLPYAEQQRQWQLLRRGRYLEFNLLYDRGVRFGLAGEHPRVEGVMVSAPPLIAWRYNHEVEENSEEAKLIQILRVPKDWLAQ